MSLDINSIGGFPQTSAYEGIYSSPAGSGTVPASEVSKPESQPVTEKPQAAESNVSVANFAAAASKAAAEVDESDPFKAFIEGVAADLQASGSDMFEALAQVNDLSNALSFAMESNRSMMFDDSLESIS